MEIKKLNVSDIYKNTCSLELAPNKTLNRCLGFRVGYPHFREGADAVVCELETEYISVNTTSGACWPKLGSINSLALEKSELMIERIDDVINELQAQGKVCTR